jgi:putative acetyltransferase
MSNRPTSEVPNIDVVVRPEREADFEAISEVVRLAFRSHVEERIVRDIRASDYYIPVLALVATVDERVVGHVMVSHTDLDTAGGRQRIAMLSPLAVHPGRQGEGIGSRLVREVIARADARGEPLIVLEGSPLYYPRFGFRHSVPEGIVIHLPDWAPAEAAMMIPLSRYRPELRGTVVYPPAFDAATH